MRIGLNVDEIILSKNDKAVFERLLYGKVEIELIAVKLSKACFFLSFFLHATVQASET